MAEKIVAPAVNVGIDDIDKLSEEQRDIAKRIHDAAVQAGVDPEFALATAWQENRFRPSGKSKAGAIGTMQIMPSTARGYGITLKELKDPQTNINLGIQILKDALDRNEGDKRLTLIEYNAGPKAVDRFVKSKEDMSVLPEETQNYIKSIDSYHALEGDSPFDNLGMAEEPVDGASPFGDTGELPPHLRADAETTEQPSMTEQITTHMFQNPSEPSVGLGGAYAQSKINDAMQKQAFERGLQRAQMAPPEVPPVEPPVVAEEPLTSGDKWSQKTVGAQGPGGASTTEAARNYRIQQRLQVAPDVENPSWQPNRSGVILPKGTQEVIEAEQRAMNAQEARRLVDEALANESPLKRASRTVSQFQERPIPRMFGRIGSVGRLPVVGPLSTGTMAGYSMHKFNQAEELEQSGDSLGAAMARLNGFASGIGAIPTTPSVPLNILKGVGMAGSLGITGAEKLRDYMFPYKSVVKEKPSVPQIKKADGGYIPLSLKDVYFHRKARG